MYVHLSWSANRTVEPALLPPCLSIRALSYFFILNTQGIKFNSQKLLLTFFSSDILSMLMGTLRKMVMTSPHGPTPGLSGKLYLPPSPLKLGLIALMYMASFTPLSNYLGSVVSHRYVTTSSRRKCRQTGRKGRGNLVTHPSHTSPRTTVEHHNGRS